MAQFFSLVLPLERGGALVESLAFSVYGNFIYMYVERISFFSSKQSILTFFVSQLRMTIHDEKPHCIIHNLDQHPALDLPL